MLTDELLLAFSTDTMRSHGLVSQNKSKRALFIDFIMSIDIINPTVTWESTLIF